MAPTGGGSPPDISLFGIFLFAVYIISCIVVATHRSKKFSFFEVLMQGIFFTPLMAVLINILVKLDKE